MLETKPARMDRCTAPLGGSSRTSGSDARPDLPLEPRRPRSSSIKRPAASSSSCPCTSCHSRIRMKERWFRRHQLRSAELPFSFFAFLQALQRRRKERKSLPGSRNAACARSAAPRPAVDRSRGSCTERAATIARISGRQDSSTEASTTRPSRGSIGIEASDRPTLVSSPFRVTAPSSRSVSYPSRTSFADGCSTKGKESGVPSRSDAICRITLARFDRRISGGVNSGRLANSSASHNRMHSPGAMRPHRPLRWFALDCAIGSTGRRWTRLRGEYRAIRAVPTSTTPRIRGTVSDVSATLVASTIRRRLPGWKT